MKFLLYSLHCHQYWPCAWLCISYAVPPAPGKAPFYFTTSGLSVLYSQFPKYLFLHRVLRLVIIITEIINSGEKNQIFSTFKERFLNICSKTEMLMSNSWIQLLFKKGLGEGYTASRAFLPVILLFSICYSVHLDDQILWAGTVHSSRGLFCIVAASQHHCQAWIIGWAALQSSLLALSTLKCWSRKKKVSIMRNHKP